MLRFFQDYTAYVSGIWNQNWPGFIRRHRLLLGLAFLASAADCLSTIYFMLNDPDMVEAHPVVRYLSWGIGPIAGPIVGKLLQFAFLLWVAAFLRRWAVYILGTATFLYAYAAWYNIWGHQFYTPLFLRALQPLITFQALRFNL